MRCTHRFHHSNQFGACSPQIDLCRPKIKKVHTVHYFVFPLLLTLPALSHFWALCLDIVSSGAVTASMSLLMVVLVFQAMIPLSTFFFAFTPRLYALTVLSNFFTDRSPYSIQQAMDYQGREHGRRVVETSKLYILNCPRSVTPTCAPRRFTCFCGQSQTNSP